MSFVPSLMILQTATVCAFTFADNFASQCPLVFSCRGQTNIGGRCLTKDKH